MNSGLRQLFVIAATAVAVSTLSARAGVAQEPGARRGDPPLVSPDVGADRRVTFRLRAPEAKMVTVSGDFGNDVELRKGGDGVWSATVGPLDPEMYVYYFTADGVRLPDPSNPQVKIGYVTSTTTSLFTVPGRPPVAMPGMVIVGETMQQVEHRIAPVARLVIARRAGTFGGDAALYERDLLEDVIPMIDSKYRTIADRKRRAIVGFSMGGGQAGHFGLRHLDTFSRVGIMSAGMAGGPDSEPLATLAANKEKANKQIDLLWIACGKDDAR